MNYFNKTKKKRVPKLDRPNSSSLEFESLSRSLPLARFHELQRDGESFGDPKKPRKVSSFFRLDRIVLLLLLFSWLRITHNAVCVCVCVCGCERGVFAREGRHGSVVFAWLHRLPLSRGRRVQRFSSLQRSLSWDVACSKITDRRIRFEDIVQLSLNNDDGVFL